MLKELRQLHTHKESVVLCKKDPCPNNLTDACQSLTRWRNNKCGKSIHTESNDGKAFATISSEDDDEVKKGKKKISCF